MSDIQPVNTTYEPFSLEPEYIAANQGFVERQDMGHVSRFLDLACGTGTVSQLLLGRRPGAHLNGVDLDPVQIGLTVDKFRSLGHEVREGFELTTDVVNEKPVLCFGVGSADELPFPEASFDCVTISNAIHLMPDKEAFLGAVSRVLKPGGVFGFNTTFYAGSMPPGSDKVYFEWLQQATDYIKAKSKERVAAGGEPIKRKKGTTRVAFQNRWFSPDEWTELLTSFGLRTHDTFERLVEVDARGFALVGAYGGLAEVLMSGYPVEESSEALQACARPAMEAVGIESVVRTYLELWATKD